MIPIFHAAGHLAYAKCTRLTLQQMDTLKDHIPETEYKQFTENVFFTIHRKNIYFNGNFSDQTIEQDLMMSIKAKGGLGHGGGITEYAIPMGAFHALLYTNLPIFGRIYRCFFFVLRTAQRFAAKNTGKRSKRFKNIP